MPDSKGRRCRSYIETFRNLIYGMTAREVEPCQSAIVAPNIML